MCSFSFCGATRSNSENNSDDGCIDSTSNSIDPESKLLGIEENFGFDINEIITESVDQNNILELHSGDNSDEQMLDCGIGVQ